MAKNRKFAEIIDRCLSQLQAGKASLCDCLEAYPEFAEDLEPLLKTALETSEHIAPPGPGVAYRKSSQARILNRLRRKVKREAQPRRLPALRLRWKLRPAYALAGLLLLIGLLGGSAGAAYAAGDALPGDTLYGLKRGMEEAQLALSLSPEADAELLLVFADRRLGEAEALLQDDREEDLQAALAGYETMLRRLIALSIRADLEKGINFDRLDGALGHHQQVLQAVLERAPEQAQGAISDAIDHSRRGQDAVEKTRQEKGPNDLAPGQLKKTPEAGSEEVEKPGPGRTPKPTKTPKATKDPKQSKTTKAP